MPPKTSTQATTPSETQSNPWFLNLLGLLLFLFIPVVLFLLVAHPEPVGLSLGMGVTLMLGHRFIAKPYMSKVRPMKCLWSNRIPARHSSETLTELSLLTARGEPLAARVCPEHLIKGQKFFAFLDAWRWPLRAGIFIPLLILLGSLIATVAGAQLPLPEITAFFQLVVGITVNVAAYGYLFMEPLAKNTVPFPAHNFFLLGVRTLLWIFRIMGLWWIYSGLTGLFTG